MRRARAHRYNLPKRRFQAAVSHRRLFTVDEEENGDALRAHRGTGDHREIRTTALY